jgi:uncharacterized membrane protein YphA (DoxX/SURF4 family)
MGAQVQTGRAAEQIPHWNAATSLAFRFSFAYFVLFSLSNQTISGLFPIPNVDVPDASEFWLVRQTVFWAAAKVFRVPSPLVYTGSGSGDKTFDWVLTFCVLVLAILTTAVWSVLDRKRANYAALDRWFRVFIRFALASEMFVYGMSKIVPLQMPFPFLARLVEPFGNFSPMGVLWYSIGASPAYEIFAGCAEVLAGILLVIPRTTTVGALVCLADAVEVFMLNMAYDVPVKLYSFHLILMAIFLLAPDLPRLADFFFRHRPVEASAEPPLFPSRRANHIAAAVQILFGACLLGANAYNSWTGWHTYGRGAPKPPLYGIWNVDQVSVDGEIRPPLLTDHDRWRRAIFDRSDSVALQRMDDSFVYYHAAINLKDRSISLSKGGDKNWKAKWAFERVNPDQLILNGDMDAHKIQMRLSLVDWNQFLLVNRGFHWIQEYPFNR